METNANRSPFPALGYLPWWDQKDAPLIISDPGTFMVGHVPCPSERYEDCVLALECNEQVAGALSLAGKYGYELISVGSDGDTAAIKPGALRGIKVNTALDDVWRDDPGGAEEFSSIVFFHDKKSWLAASAIARCLHTNCGEMEIGVRLLCETDGMIIGSKHEVIITESGQSVRAGYSGPSRRAA